MTGPLDVWLIDDRGSAVHVTTGSDWCLIVEASRPHTGYAMGESGLVRVEAVEAVEAAVEAMGDSWETPFARHIGEDVVAVREEFEPNTGRTALELAFPSGRVRCESWGGELRLMVGQGSEAAE